MKKSLLFFIFLISITSYAQIRHYYFIGMNRELLKDTATWSLPIFEGVQ